MTMTTKNEEIEQVILRTIMRKGLDAIPNNYEFLMKYNLKEVYFHSIDLSMSGFPLDLKSELCHLLKDSVLKIDFSHLKTLYYRCGKSAIMNELYNNELYFQTFIKCIKDDK